MSSNSSKRFPKIYKCELKSEKEIKQSSIKFRLFDKCLNRLESDLKNATNNVLFQKIGFFPSENSISDGLFNLANALQYKNYKDAMEIWEMCLEITLHFSLSCAELEKRQLNNYNDFTRSTYIIHAIIADCLVELNQLGEEALVHLNQSFVDFYAYEKEVRDISTKMQNKNECDALQDSQMYKTFQQKEKDFFTNQLLFHILVGNVLFKMEKYESSLFIYQILLGIILSSFDDNYYFETICYSRVGIYLLKMNYHSEALFYLKLSLRIKENSRYNFDEFGEFELNFDSFYAFRPNFILFDTYYHLGKCLMKLNQFEEVLPYFFEALEIITKGKLDEENDKILTKAATTYIKKKQIKNLANILHDLGLYHMKQNRFKEAKSYLQRAFNIYNELFETKKIELTRIELLTCFMEIYQRDCIEEQLKISHKSRKKVISVIIVTSAFIF